MLTDVKGAIIEQIFIPSFSLSDQTAVTQTCQERQETWADEIIKKNPAAVQISSFNSL